MGPVLVGVDGSPTSVAALRWAAWFARATGRDLVVAHAWQRGPGHQPLVAAAEGVTGVDDLEAAVLTGLGDLVDQVLGADQPPVHRRALRGDIAGALVKEADAAPGTLLVAGARGAGGARRALLGSVSQQLVACPRHTVVVVPDDVVLPTPGESFSMVVGVDGSTGSSRAVRWSAAVAAAATHAGWRDPRVVAVHALEPPLPDLATDELASVQAEMEDRLNQEWCAPLLQAQVAVVAQVAHGDPRVVLARAAEAARPVCVVLGSRGLGTLSQRLLGSVTHRLVRELDWPVVVVPAPRDRVDWRP